MHIYDLYFISFFLCAYKRGLSPIQTFILHKFKFVSLALYRARLPSKARLVSFTQHCICSSLTSKGRIHFSSPPRFSISSHSSRWWPSSPVTKSPNPASIWTSDYLAAHHASLRRRTYILCKSGRMKKLRTALDVARSLTAWTASSISPQHRLQLGLSVNLLRHLDQFISTLSWARIQMNTLIRCWTFRLQIFSILWWVMKVMFV